MTDENQTKQTAAEAATAEPAPAVGEAATVTSEQASATAAPAPAAASPAPTPAAASPAPTPAAASPAPAAGPADQAGQDQGPEEAPVPKPAWFRPLLVGLGVMAASVLCVVDPNVQLGRELADANAQGTLVVIAFAAMVVCGIVLDQVDKHRNGKRLPLAPVMGASTVLLVLFALLSCVFLTAGGKLVGTIGGGLFGLYVLAGICGGVGGSLAVSGWHTCVRGGSWLYGLLYLALSAVVCYLLVELGLVFTALVPETVYAAALAVLGGALLHVQVRFLDK